MQKHTRVRRHHSPAQRDKILAAFHQSKLPQTTFADQVGIALSTLLRWLREAPARKPAQSPLVPVPNLFSAVTTAPAYRLRFPQGMILEVASGFQTEELGTLLQLIQAP